MCSSHSPLSMIGQNVQMYSNGVSEEILGKAIKKFSFPRDEIVVMTKVCIVLTLSLPPV